MEGDEFMETLYGELESNTEDSACVDMLVDFASLGDYGAVADVLARLVKEDHPGWAAVVCWEVMRSVGTDQPGQQNYHALALVFGHLIDEDKSSMAAEICREMFLRYNGTTTGGYMQMAFLFGAMVGSGHQEWPAHILQQLLQDGEIEDIPAKPLDVATESMGQLVEMGYPSWAAHIASYLVVTHTDDAGLQTTDYGMLASLLANMVSTTHVNWAAEICSVLPELCCPEASAGEDWFQMDELLASVGTFDSAAPKLISQMMASAADAAAKEVADASKEESKLGDGVAISMQQLTI